MKIPKDSPVICPHCGVDQEDGPIQDYAIPGRIGELSRAKTDCCSCDKFFTVENTGTEEEFLIKPILPR